MICALAVIKCMDNTAFLQLPKDGSCKTVYMGHRRWLKKDDEWRSPKDLFDGTEEHRVKPRTSNGHKILKLLNNWEECPEPGKKRKAPDPMCTV